MSAFRAPHNAVSVGGSEAVAGSAHPSNPARRASNDQPEVRYALGDNGSRADKRIASNGRAADDGGIRADRAAAFQRGRLVQRVSVHLGSWIRDIGQYTGRPQKHVVF